MSEKVCVEDGCNKPRMIGRNGKALTRCEPHMKAYWNENAAKAKEKRKARAAAKKAGQPGKKLAVRPFGGNPPHPPTPSPTSGEGEKETVQVAMTAHEIALEATAQDDLPVTEAECEGCTECVYKEVVSLLRQQVPAIDELVRLKKYEAVIQKKTQDILSKLGR